MQWPSLFTRTLGEIPSSIYSPICYWRRKPLSLSFSDLISSLTSICEVDEGRGRTQAHVHKHSAPPPTHTHTESHLRFLRLCSLTVTPSYRPIMQKCWLIHGFHANLDAQRKLKLAGVPPSRLLCVSVYVCVWSVLQYCAHCTLLSHAVHHFTITGQTHTHIFRIYRICWRRCLRLTLRANFYSG